MGRWEGIKNECAYRTSYLRKGMSFNKNEMTFLTRKVVETPTGCQQMTL